jgi:hypothetical protein
MHTFATNTNMNEGDKGIGVLPALRVMPATKAADCGVSSSLCRWLYRNGLAPSMYSLVQEMGRVDCIPITDLGNVDNR